MFGRYTSCPSLLSNMMMIASKMVMVVVAVVVVVVMMIVGDGDAADGHVCLGT